IAVPGPAPREAGSTGRYGAGGRGPSGEMDIDVNCGVTVTGTSTSITCSRPTSATSCGCCRDTCSSPRCWSSPSGASATFLGLAAGGLLAGINWRLVFLVSVPFGLFGTVWAYLKLPDNGVRSPARPISDTPANPGRSARCRGVGECPGGNGTSPMADAGDLADDPQDQGGSRVTGPEHDDRGPAARAVGQPGGGRSDRPTHEVDDHVPSVEPGARRGLEGEDQLLVLDVHRLDGEATDAQDARS